MYHPVETFLLAAMYDRYRETIFETIRYIEDQDRQVYLSLDAMLQLTAIVEVAIFVNQDLTLRAEHCSLFGAIFSTMGRSDDLSKFRHVLNVNTPNDEMWSFSI